MAESTTITLDYLEELKDESLTGDEAKEALEGAIILCNSFCKEKDIVKAKKAYEYAKYWGDDKENEELFRQLGQAITNAEKGLGKEIEELKTKAGESFAAKKFKQAKEIFQKILKFNPKDSAIIKRLEEVEVKINPPASATATSKSKKNGKKEFTIGDCGDDVRKIVDKLTIIIKREHLKGNTVARAVRAKQVLLRMASKQLID